MKLLRLILILGPYNLVNFNLIPPFGVNNTFLGSFFFKSSNSSVTSNLKFFIMLIITFLQSTSANCLPRNNNR